MEISPCASLSRDDKGGMRLVEMTGRKALSRDDKLCVPSALDRLLGQFRCDVGAIHADGMRFVNVMFDRPELKGILHVVEFDLEIKFRGKPGCVFCREKEFVSINLQAT